MVYNEATKKNMEATVDFTIKVIKIKKLPKQVDFSYLLSPDR